MNLSNTQKAAISHIEKYALEKKVDVQKTIENVCIMCNIAQEELIKTIATIKNKASVALHFHPDRLNDNLQSVAASLLESGIYKNQFETKISNGKLSPYPEGPRASWENQMFGNVYATAKSFGKERPCYGALDLMRHPDGPSPRFGSCYFILNPSVSQRCTFTYMDSYRNPPEKGTLKVFDLILSGLLTESFERNYALGQDNIRPDALMKKITENLESPYENSAGRMPARNLDHYIEAQVHGAIRLKEDVAILVADPAFQKIRTGMLLEKLCLQYEIKLLWHSGFQMQVSDVPTNFRGSKMPSLAARIAENNRFDVSSIGVAAANLKRHPENWEDRGTYEECLQELKLLWHILLRFGECVVV